MTEESRQKSSLANMKTDGWEIKRPHLLWCSVKDNCRDIRKGIEQCRLMTGTYKTQNIELLACWSNIDIVEMNAKVLPPSRSELDIYLKGNELKIKFHDLFDAYKISQADNKKKLEKKKSKKKSKSKGKDKKSKRDKSPEVTEIAPPTLEVCANPSLFTVYSTVRQSILEQCMKEATQIYHQSQTIPSDSESDDEKEEKSKEATIKLPKIVGLGLTGVFELVRDTRQKYPELCIRALTALLDMLQGQQPESMKSEPPDLIENFFNLLMEISCEPGPDKSLSALACSALLSLVTALGDTGKLLTAVMAMLMSPGALSSQDIVVPGILTGLQKSVQAVLLGRSILPDWLHQGIKTGSQIDKFAVEDLPELKDHTQNCAIASDGEYLYLLNKEGLFKVGSGYKGTIKSHIYQYKTDFPNSSNSWLTCAGDQLFCRTDDNTHPCLSVVDSKSFDLKNSFHLDGKGHGPCALFSDGDYIGQIASSKDDSFVVRLYNPAVSPMSVVSELPLKLTRKCMDVIGSAGYEPETEKRSINTGFDEDSVFIVSGKEFALVRTSGNKVLYTGRSQALGIKQGGPSQGKWVELPITKSPKIIQISTGHEGQHALLVSEDGSLFFVGTPKRGEDGDASSSKARRQPKAVKPKKIIRMETMSKHVVYTACNNGSSGILTKEGEVYIFGKDTTHCDHSTGQVTDLKEVVVTQIALGKAHTVVMTDRGQVYTFGINNKGQCGRDFQVGGNKEANNVTMTEEEEETEIEDVLCPDGKHKWKREQCMVCTVCGECTGYGLNCCNSGDKERQPVLPCGCGAGESGCSECGICRTCAGEQLMEDHGKPMEFLARHKDYLPFDVEQLLAGNEVKINHVPDLPDTPLGIFFKRFLYNKKEPKRKEASKQQAKAAESHDQEADYNKVASLPPQEIYVGTGDIPATQISCGQHHTVVLLQNGDVYVFGNNNYGQLGQGDTTIRGAPVQVSLPMGATQVAAGAQHTVVLLSNGQVFTFGNYKSGAIGRGGPDEAGAKNKKALWHALPGPVPGIGARYGRRATWIGASGDQTFMRIDESLINAHILAASKVFANQTSIGLIPTGEENTAVMKCLMINKVDGSCRSFGGNEQIDLSKQAVCLDPVYDVLWSYSPESKEITCFNSLVSEARPLTSQSQTHCDLFKPELAVPIRMGHNATRSHCALNVLGCLDTLNIAQQLQLTVKEEAKEKQMASKVYSKEDFSAVNRFASHGGGWGYSGHSLEAIRFMSDTDVLLGGFGLFGGRGEYFGRIKLFELGAEGGDNETDGEMISETDEVAYECGAREKYAMLFEEPVQIQANMWYVACARISGPSSDCGSNGQPVISTDDQVVFKFKSSKKSNNGTDVNAGQIPQLLYRLPSRENSGVVRKVDNIEPAHILSQDFACSVTPECFDALLKLIQWAWTTFNSSIIEADGLKGDNYTAAMSDIKRLVYVNKACLRLVRTYVSQTYPDGTSPYKPLSESEKLAECVGKTQDLLRNILAEEVQPSTKVRVYLSEPGSHSVFHALEEEVLNECHITFRACFHAFYPTGSLKWLCLCDLLGMLEPEMLNIGGYGRLLAAVMEAMCHPTIRLTNIMPINSEPKTEEILRRQSVNMDDNTNSMARLNDLHKFPSLVSHMTYRMEMAGLGGNQVSFCEVLDKLLTIVTLPVRQELDRERSSYPSVLVDNTCALLSTIVSELSATSMGLEMDLTQTSTPLLVTPNRFTRTSQSACWNTGNGSPDAIAFSVDKPGIVIAGVCVYGGAGQYQYELELLDDISGGQNDPSPSQRWNNIEVVKGTYGTEDCVNEIAEIKFDRPVSIKEGVKYTIRLKNHGPKTLNGDGGMNKVKCPDGTIFTFSACSLSSNGSNHTRGQIPQILYYSAPQDGENQQQSNKTLAELQARKNAIDIVAAICRMATDMLHRANSMPTEMITTILGSSHLFSSLIPMILAHIGPVASQDPRGSVQVLGMIQDILPAVANLNNHISPAPQTNELNTDGSTTSQHYAVVESEHPYKPATVSHYKVTFPDNVKWMAIEFDPACGTAQNEDVLQLMIPSRLGSEVVTPATVAANRNEETKTSQKFCSVFKKFSGVDNWPKQALILPGNQVVFSLETASDYVKDEKACFFGFKCVVVGYEWKLQPEETIAQLERELAYLGGMCAGSLIKRDISLPPVTVEELDEDMDYIEEGSLMVFNEHAKLLGKGFALSHPPTIMQALEGNLPFCWQSNERSFLKDFVACNSGTSGGRMARWLQPDSYLDPGQCELVYNKEDLRCSWPALLTVLTKDQYGQVVQVNNLKVEVKAIPVDQGILGDDSKKMRRLSKPDNGNLTFGGLPPPCLDVPYEPTVKDKKDIFHAICMMKQYENYSFEELRVAAPAVPRPSENMLVRSNNDGTYLVNWTPGSVGLYSIHVTVDGFDTSDVYKVDVKDPPQGITPPSQTEKKPHHTSKLRKFVQKYSAGLRARTNPSLQSEQMGVIPTEGIISFVDEIHNDDGVWLRLSQESIREYCTNGHIEGWVLQYNQHLGKTLLVPVEEPKSITKEIIKETIRRNLRAETSKHKRGPGMYQVIKCGSFGHNIRCGPSLKSTPVGMLTMEDKILGMQDISNPDGHWIKIDPESAESYCQTKKGEFWSLAQGKEGIVYLQHEHDIKEGITPVENEPFFFSSPGGATGGFNFGASPQIPSTNSVFGSLSTPTAAFGRSASLPTNSFSFGFQDNIGSSPSAVPAFGQRPVSEGYAVSFDSSFNSSDMTHTASQPSFGTDSSFTPGSSSFSKPDTSLRSKSPMSLTRSPVSGSPKSSRRDPGIPPELQGVSVKDLVKALVRSCSPTSKNYKQVSTWFGHEQLDVIRSTSIKRLAAIIGESRANGNGPTPVPSPPGTPKKSGSRSSSPHLAPDVTGSPRTGSPIRSLSPKLSKSDSKSVVSDSSSQASLKEETFTTPPDSPIPTRKTQLKKEPSFDRFSQSPPASPILKAKLSDSGKDGRLSPGSSGLLSASHASVATRRDSFGSPPTLPGRKDSVGSPIPQRRESFGSPRHTSPVRTISPQRGSPRRGSSPLLNYNSPRASPVMGSDQTAGDKYFNIGAGSAKDESPRMSPKLGRKERRQLRSKRDRPSSPSSRDGVPSVRNRSSSTSIIQEKPKEPVKEALSPSVAECLRAVFAAFLWHEGIVHDAMACASFLKFHPDLNKEMSKFANKKKQERIRVRHATDSSKEINKKRENININEARVRFNLEPQFLRSDSEKSDKSDKSEKSDKSDSPVLPRELKFAKKPVERHKSEGSVSHVGQEEPDKEKDKSSALPLTLQHLVYFWEELSTGLLRIILQDLVYPSPAVTLKAKKGEKKDKEKEKEKKNKKKKEQKQVMRGNAIGEAMVGIFGGGGAGAAYKGDTWCELCGGTFPHPVTYHMRQTHPGCGRHAGGKGYNSSGNFCGGWAGNCGEGGYGGSGWYLICETCRDKYLKDKKQQQKEKDKAKKQKKKNAQSRAQAILSPQEPHVVLKSNAMFLLDLASSSGFSLPVNSHKKHQSQNHTDLLLPSVYEEYGQELNPFPQVPFTFLVRQGAQNSDSAFADDFYIDAEERVFVRSGSMSIASKNTSFTRPRLPTEPRHSPLARSGSLGQDMRPALSHISPPSPKDFHIENNANADDSIPVPKSAGTSPDTDLEQIPKKTAFQRSISEYVSDDDGHGNERNYGKLSGRRRNNSGGITDGGMSLLKHPSSAMSKLIASVDKGGADSEGDRALQRPVMSFIVQRHDLEGLQLAMRQALRKSACRVFAMQALNWLLRSVTQDVCLHDLMWFFVASLTPPGEEEEEEEEEPEKGKEKEKEKKKKETKKDQEDAPVCDHPLQDVTVAGQAVEPLLEVFHTLLQTTADVMMHLPWGSAIQQMAVHCFCLNFRPSDHQFLHESHVFSNISRILSKSEEESEETAESPQAFYTICNLKDLTPSADIKVSSRQAMISSLTDNSTETFWESGDEDRNKTKTITVTCFLKAYPKTIYVHIDNTRDLANKVASLTFNAGPSTDDLTKLEQVDVDSRYTGWLSCHIPEPKCRCVHLELKGPDHNLRIRQIKVLGEMEGENIYLPVKKSAVDLQQENCETETLRVFRMLTSQVFGKLIIGNETENGEKEKSLVPSDSIDGDHDLKEHMVGILFSRSKLSHLQKQVCSHIVQGIRKETSKMREEWENVLGTKTPLSDNSDQDAYCFELLSMVLALSGSGVGRIYLAQQYPLLQDLFSLLHTGTPRIQRQVLSVLRRVLPEAKPQTLASILSVPNLPPSEYSIVSLASREDENEVYDVNKPGILDVLLACICKAITVQTKVKGPQKGVTSVTMADCPLDSLSASSTGSRWWMRGKMDSSMANTIISLIQDMASGCLSETWATVTKAAVAEAILALTKLDEKLRAPQTCIKTPTLWLALSSLCVLDQDHVERLTSGQWVSSPNGQHGQPRPTCDNHDDGETQAIILCTDCGNLCADCDRYLHLPRKNRNHQRQVFKEEEEAIRVDLHEGCGRTKLFWLMALADSRTLKAMVEFREGKQSTSKSGPGVCRFCGATSNTGLLAIGNVCADPDCQEYAKTACTKTLPCGHPCRGIKDEDPCLPCLHRCGKQEMLKQDADDMCMICFTEALSAAPAIQLKCNHVFHLHCSRRILSQRWVGPRITFGFSLCPICKSTIDQVVLRDILKPIQELFEDVRRKAMMRLEYEGLHKAEAITTPGARFFQDPAGFAMERYAYYVCFKCKKAYYGGEARCEEQAGAVEDYDPEELVCGGCSDVSRAQVCPKHGTDFLEYKCRYCCSVAVFFCFGTTHFCNACHDDFQRITNIPKLELPRCPAGPRGKLMEGDECPLHVQHPPTGEEFALGCGVCRNAHTF